MNAEGLLAHYENIGDAPDAIARLRRFVLDLAIRGKLVRQSPSDEPASRLLKRIAEEMQAPKWAREKKPASPISEITAAPFSIPANWRWSKLVEIGILSPRNEAPDALQASFVPMPMIAAEYGVANKHEIRPWGEIKKGYTHFANGDVGLAKITPCFENGKSTVFRNLTGGIGSGTTELHIVRPMLVDPDYIVLFLKSPHFIGSGIPRMTGTAGQKRVPMEYFARTPFPLPPLAEQQRIVAKVDELMALCDQLEAARAEREVKRDRLAAASLARLNAPDPDRFKDDARFALDALPALTTRPDQIKQVRQTVLNLAVRGKLAWQNPSDETASELLKRIAKERVQIENSMGNKKGWKVPTSYVGETPYVIPNNWAWALFADVASIQSNLVDPRAYGSYPHIAPDNIESGTGRLLPYETIGASGVFSSKHLFKAGCLLYSKIRPALAKVTHVDFDGLCSADMYPLRPFVDRMYLKYFMLSEAFVRQSVTEDNRVAMPKINQESLSRILVAVPPLSEQRRIVGSVEQLMTLCDHLKASLSTGEDARRRLLDALLAEALTPALEEAA